ncbi:hypothetical protein EV356DRAFT_518054 [Viridothelium virens]|uniref:Protein kinase domain-containing protein n=1 Tax=Viridothelium virens TaxID=1048519 RepID=A0A6A6H1W3_VIRVR|nr:hypothetical protein EV356DRAFT_518054 [Viridothelium virens]
MAERPKDSLKFELNERLKTSIRSESYGYVKVLTLYWTEGEIGFREEAQEFGRFVQDIYGYDVEEFEIPTLMSAQSLRGVVLNSAVAAGKHAISSKTQSLLIIHYGGHGDKDDDKHAGQERRSVWAAYAVGGPTLEWYKIQEDLMDFDIDILLILDCCFASQAGRASDRRTGRILALAAAAKNEKTRLPGDDSYTQGIMREMKKLVLENGYTSTLELHQRLLSRKAGLQATPQYIPIRLGHRDNDIRLTSTTVTVSTSADVKVSGSLLRFVLRTENLDRETIQSLMTWLGSDVPVEVTGMEIEEVLVTTKGIHNFLKRARLEETPLSTAMDDSNWREITSAWDRVLDLFHQYDLNSGNDESKERKVLVQNRIESFLSQLRSRNDECLDAVEHSALAASDNLEDFIVDQAIEDPTLQNIGIADQLHLRRIIRSEDTWPGQEKLSGTSAVVAEYKPYSPSRDQSDMEALTARVSQLSALLKANKKTAFRSLRCCGWEDEPANNRFILYFEIPVRFQDPEPEYRSLSDLLKNPRNLGRPSLDARLKVAHILAKAVQSWHNIGWVHEGISSSHILFFVSHQIRAVVYDEPFLQGFDLARPNVAPSIGRYVDDITFNVYRHPARQGPSREGHRKVHDFYSLGVVLLELGLWQDANAIVMPKRGERLEVSTMQEKLQAAARDRLPHYAGVSYEKAVTACLSGQPAVEKDDRNESELAKTFKKLVIDELAQGVRII